MLRVERAPSIRDLNRLRSDWNQLAGDNPFISWEWLVSWAEEFVSAGNLYVLVVSDTSGRIVGIAPWHIRTSFSRGKAIEFLGSGSACSDYLSLLCVPHQRAAVCRSLAEWLGNAGRAVGHVAAWDLLDLDGIDADDRVIDELLACLERKGCLVHCRTGMSCWRIDLPATWDEYLSLLSKAQRKHVRRVLRQSFESGKVVVRTAGDESALADGLRVFMRLHQRRWTAVGQPGCFSDPKFSRFILTVSQRLFQRNAVRLLWAEYEGRPIAADYSLVSPHCVYSYQTGIDPETYGVQPGRVLNIACIQHALSSGQQAFDFLRGDEPYKASWRAQRRATKSVRVVPAKTIAVVRDQMWWATSNIKSWLKDRTGGATAIG